MIPVRRNIIFIGAAMITGLISILFGIGVVQASAVFTALTIHRPWVPFLLCPLGFAGIVLITRRVFPGAQGSGIPQAIAALDMAVQADIDRVLSLRIAVGKFLLTLVGFVVGASIGKEGPTVQISCAVMNICGRFGLERSQTLQRLLILAGGAAGITCAFNAPLAGIAFAIEEMAGRFDRRQLRSITLAAFASFITLLSVVGDHPYFGIAPTQLFGADTPRSALFYATLCALLGGIFGGIFSRILIAPTKLLPPTINRLAGSRPALFAGLCGLILAALGTLSHGQIFDASYSEARAALTQGVLPPTDFAPLKYLATLISYLSGIPGGIFAPSLAVGVGEGTLFNHLIPALPVSAFAMIGMAGYFSGVVQAPITATIIVIEMTGDPAMAVPVAIAAILGTIGSRLICPEPIYHAMAREFLRLTTAPVSGPITPPSVSAPDTGG